MHVTRKTLILTLAEESKGLAPMNDMTLNYHLMHPGGDSGPGDPNAAFCLDGVYHLHYILAHPWKDGQSFSFIHVTSTDMLHWTWQTTNLSASQDPKENRTETLC